MRILIAGGPKCGKTSFADRCYPNQAWHTDCIIPHYEWTEQSQVVLEWMDQPGPWVIEGVTVYRSLRYWLFDHTLVKPCDEIYWLDTPRIALTVMQSRMLTYAKRVWPVLRPQLEARGVLVHEGAP